MSIAHRALPLIVGGLALALTGCPAQGGARPSEASAVTIKGSDTMVHLVTAWSEAYMKAHPDQQVSVTGGGSGTGIAAMINGTTDVCMASREMKASELELAKQRGVSPLEHVVGRDGIAIVVNPENPVTALSLDQLRQIYNGTLTSWRQVGGPDQPIQLLSRESSSGTYGFFNEFVLQKDDFAASARLMPSTAAIVQAAGQDTWSIGYVGLGYAHDPAVKIVGIKAEADAAPVVPTLETVAAGTYPISRPLYLYTQGEPHGVGAAFLAYALSPAGQAIVADTGYIPVGAVAADPQKTK